MISQHIFSKYLEPGEKVVAVFHRHPFVFIPELIKTTLLGFVAPIFFWYLFPEFALFFVLWMLMSTVRLIRALCIYYHDVILLTNSSIVDVYWHGFFDKTSARLEYPMLEGVTVEIRGFFRTMFNVGTISIQRQGASTPLSLPDAIAPRKVERKIMAYHEQFTVDQSLKDADALKNLLTTMVRHHSKTEGAQQQKHHHKSQAPEVRKFRAKT